MLLKDMPEHIRDEIIPIPQDINSIVSRCHKCNTDYMIQDLKYTCPKDGGLLDVVNLNFDKLKETDPQNLKDIFAYRAILNDPSIKCDQALHGVFRFQELVMPFVNLESIVYLGEANTPVIRANNHMRDHVGVNFEVKHDGINPSASFKDRGMSSAVSSLNHLLTNKYKENILGVCASTGDTSAAAALYLSYLLGMAIHGGRIKSSVLLPEGKVTPAQLLQPLSSGASVIEITKSVFDDCMGVVEELSEKYDVALLNSKNGLRIEGQKSFAFECAERWGYDMNNKVVALTVGNAGNITSNLKGFLDLYRLGLTDSLPKILGVQSEKADPIVSWMEDDIYKPVNVSERGPSTAQAAYIGNPVSFPRVERLTKEYKSNGGKVYAVRVSEQEIMDTMLYANRNGLTVCTQGGEAIAGLRAAVKVDIVQPYERAIVDSTSHQLKFSNFQLDYYEDRLRDYGIIPNQELVNKPVKLEKDVRAVAAHLGLN